MDLRKPIQTRECWTFTADVDLAALTEVLYNSHNPEIHIQHIKIVLWELLVNKTFDFAPSLTAESCNISCSVKNVASAS